MRGCRLGADQDFSGPDQGVMLADDRGPRLRSCPHSRAISCPFDRCSYLLWLSSGVATSGIATKRISTTAYKLLLCAHSAGASLTNPGFGKPGPTHPTAPQPNGLHHPRHESTHSPPYRPTSTPQ